MQLRKKENVMIFSHNDLDGLGCIVLANVFTRNPDYEICIPDPNDIDKLESKNVGYKVREFINSGEYKKYERVYITDLSIHPIIAKMINEVNGDYRFMLFDHHKTNLHCNDYIWGHVKVELDGRPTCGAEMLWKYQQILYGFNNTDEYVMLNYNIAKFVELVRLWDTWEWKTNKTPLSQLAYNLNAVLTIRGYNDFIKLYRSKLIKGDRDIISHNDLEIIRYINSDKTRYINARSHEINTIDVDGMKFGVLFATKYLSELGNSILHNHPELDAAAMIDLETGSVSLRTIKDTIDVSEYAKRNGGGGHAKAAGFPYNKRVHKIIMNEIFK